MTFKDWSLINVDDFQRGKKRFLFVVASNHVFVPFFHIKNHHHCVVDVCVCVCFMRSLMIKRCNYPRWEQVHIAPPKTGKIMDFKSAVNYGTSRWLWQLNFRSSMLPCNSMRDFFPTLRILTPQKWRHFEHPKTPLRNTGSFTLPLERSLGILRVSYNSVFRGPFSRIRKKTHKFHPKRGQNNKALCLRVFTNDINGSPNKMQRRSVFFGGESTCGWTVS